MDQKTYLEMRTKELEDIKKVANQIKDISNNMKYELHDQGVKMDQVEKDVEEVKTNVLKAELEINEANKIDKKNSKKIIYLVLFILFVLISILLIFITIF